MREFQLWKKQALNKLDKSFIGSIDEKIESLCDTINIREDMFTLSSCSGRISLQKDSNGKKEENIWYFVSHDKISFEKLNELLENYNLNENLIFLQESSILHICVKDLEIARNLMHIAKTSGFNQVGIIACKTKIVVEIISDFRLELPIYEKKLLVSQEYLQILVKKANSNQIRSWNSIKKLEESLK